ncbi:MAG: hypothetical protein IJO63_02120 [Bacilli bacterium]|nr:hypothetical protein [Bacilli bacterium]
MNYNSLILIRYKYIVLVLNDIKYELNLNRNIFYEGKIIDVEKFTTQYLNFFSKHKIPKSFWKKEIKVIHNSLYNKNDVEKLYNVFKDLNYRNVVLVNEKSLLDLNSKCNYLLNDDNLRLFYIDKYNTKKQLVIDKENYYTHEIKCLIKNRTNNKDLVIVGSVPLEYLDNEINYYFYEDFDEFFLKNYL